MTAPICFIDTETTSLRPDRVAWDVAWIRRDPNGLETSEQLYLPVDLAGADPAALRIGRFYDRHPLGKRLSRPVGDRGATGKVTPLQSAAAAIARATHGAYIVGAVPSFDTEILERLLRAQGYAPAWRYRLIDVCTLTAGHLGHLVGGLTDCARALDIDVPADGEHTALGDARTAMHVHDAILGRPGHLERVEAPSSVGGRREDAA